MIRGLGLIALLPAGCLLVVSEICEPVMTGMDNIISIFNILIRAGVLRTPVKSIHKCKCRYLYL